MRKRKKYLKDINSNLGESENYNSLFTYDQLIFIIKAIEEGLTYSQILVRLDLPVTRLNRDYIGNIKRGITYKREVSMILGGDAQRLDNFYRRD